MKNNVPTTLILLLNGSAESWSLYDLKPSMITYTVDQTEVKVVGSPKDTQRSFNTVQVTWYFYNHEIHLFYVHSDCAGDGRARNGVGVWFGSQSEDLLHSPIIDGRFLQSSFSKKPRHTDNASSFVELERGLSEERDRIQIFFMHSVPTSACEACNRPRAWFKGQDFSKGSTQNFSFWTEEKKTTTTTTTTRVALMKKWLLVKPCGRRCG